LLVLFLFTWVYFFSLCSRFQTYLIQSYSLWIQLHMAVSVLVPRLWRLPYLAMLCARRVFKCFRWMERQGDRITGAAGKFFVSVAVILISIGTVAFCASFNFPTFVSRSHPHATQVDVIWPSLPFPLIATPLCVLIALNLHMHYYFACTVPPGFVDDPPGEQRTGFLWCERQEGQRERARDRVHITEAKLSKCGKCGLQRPEVREYTLQCEGV
jgi:palmitoyltransferase